MIDVTLGQSVMHGRRVGLATPAREIVMVEQVGVMAAVGPVFGLSRVAAARAGLLLAAGGEFAFVAFGEAQSLGILPAAMVRELFLVVALSMALTPFLADLGQRLGKMFEKSDMKVGNPSLAGDASKVSCAMWMR